MIGFYGIIARENVLNERKRLESFSKMSDAVGQTDFRNQTVHGKHFSIGITERTIGENKDLALKVFNKDFVIGFTGYGKFAGEKKLYWAHEMIERIAPVIREKGKNALTQIEGSFSALVFHIDELILISDRLGSKNIYYYETENLFIFAPDVGRIVASSLVPKEKNIEAATQVLIAGFFLDDSTLVEKITRFPYATLFTKKVSKSSKPSIKRYWAPPRHEGPIDKMTPELIEMFSAKMGQAIAELSTLESRAIVPLSGGLDSRAIACFLSKRQKLITVTYDYGDEHRLAKKVCEALKGDFQYFSNKMIEMDYFKQSLRKLIVQQKIHTVVEQYFYTPFFREYFAMNRSKMAIYDGIYLDALFNVAYAFPSFHADNYIRVYGQSIEMLDKLSHSLKKDCLFNLMRQKYQEILSDFGNADGVGKSQLFYLRGRLSGYVNQYVLAKESFSYVLRTAHDYDLMDFGFSLSLRLRKGLLYTELFKTLPEVSKIRFKDSYGIRKKTPYEKIVDYYIKSRLKLSYFTQGVLKYSTDQRSYFFLTKKEIDNYKDLFLNRNRISELFTDSELLHLFNTIKKKQYLLQLFDRVLFLQQFYSRYNF